MTLETPKQFIATLLGVIVGLVSIGGGILAVGVWKGGTDAKVFTYTVKVDAQEARVQILESEAQDSKRDRESLHHEVTADKESNDKSFETLRQEMSKRFDRQMERLDKIADRVGAPPAPANPKQ